MFKHTFKHCHLSASSTLCDSWFGNNDQSKTTASIWKMHISEIVHRMTIVGQSSCFLGSLIPGLAHFLSVKNDIQKPLFHEFAHHCGSIQSWIMTHRVSSMERRKLDHASFCQPPKQRCPFWIFIIPKRIELQSSFTTQIVDNFHQ